MNPLSQLAILARDFGLGRALLKYYHRPIGQACQSIDEGGPWEQKRTEIGRQEMVEAAKSLKPLHVPEGTRLLEVHFLSGAKYWYQTLFCAWSLQAHCSSRITPVVYDDGTLAQEHAGHIIGAIPWTRFVWIAEIESKLDRLLPVGRYAELRRRRLSYPHLRKLTDVHCGLGGWKLVLDSDMLFFKEPRFVLDWLASPKSACHMIDSFPAYGYSVKLMEELAGAPIPSLVNVGLCGLLSESINWSELERWCTVLTTREGMSYFLEQALTAMLVANQPTVAAPPSEYLVMPSLKEGRTPAAVLHHYVAHSKRSYFQYGWRNAMAARDS